MACIRLVWSVLLMFYACYTAADNPDFIIDNGFNITGFQVCKDSINRKENITIPSIRVISEVYDGTCNRTFWKWVSWFKIETVTTPVPCQKLRHIKIPINITMEKVYYGYSLRCCVHWKRQKPGDVECRKPICPNGCTHGRCIAGDTCKCDAGWQGYTCSQDVNECYFQNGGCQHDCYNKLGSYECSCRRGYKRHSNDISKCIDINECKASKPKCFCARDEPQCKPICVNKIGSFKCQCPKGYRLYGTTSCIDVDECLSVNKCQQRCINTPGSYRCECFKGMAYIKNSCQDINECKTPNHGCEHRCLNMYRSYLCRCKFGYRLAPNRKNCIKIQS